MELKVKSLLLFLDMLDICWGNTGNKNVAILCARDNKIVLSYDIMHRDDDYIVSCVIHELLHFFDDDLTEEEVLRLENEMMKKISQKEKEIILKRIPARRTLSFFLDLLNIDLDRIIDFPLILLEIIKGGDKNGKEKS